MSETVYSCVDCRNNIGTEYLCAHCEDFRLFSYIEEDHSEGLNELGLNFGNQYNIQEKLKRSTQRCIQSLMHACQCQEANCLLPNCQNMKRLVQHSIACKLKANGVCPVCKQLIALLFSHAKYCHEQNCVVLLCKFIHRKMEERDHQQVESLCRIMSNISNEPKSDAASSSGASSPDPAV